jgi:hypothetical protein
MKRTKISCGLAVAAALALACGSSDDSAPAPTGNAMVPAAGAAQAKAPQAVGSGVPVIERVALNPPVPAPGSEIRAVVEASDPDGDVLRYEYVWTYNGKEMRRGDKPSFYVVDLEKGDKVEVTVVATDGSNRSAPMSASARAGNRPPVLSAVSLEPFGDIRAGETLQATPHASDPDNDLLRFSYRWTVNGKEAGRDRSFDTTGLKRGDKVQVEVVARDASSESRRELSPVLMLGNSPPVITQLPATRSEDGTFTYTFVAKDPDGDRNLRFFVEKGPKGMRMDAITGVLTWTPTPSQSGVHPVEVGVKDGRGEGSTFTFELTVGVQQAPATPAARGY